MPRFEPPRTRHLNTRRSHRSRASAWAGLETLEARLHFHALPGVTGDLQFSQASDDQTATEIAPDTPSPSDPAPAGDSGETGASGSGAIPLLHSLPGAPAALYLDFDGHFEPTWGSYRNLSSPAYDIDGNTASFSAIELSRIQEIWARVAEDFSPFNIDITTELPSSFANRQAQRVVIGGSSFDWYGASVGGVSYNNSFTNSLVNTSYVFSRQLNGSAKSVAEAVSHEAGHAFGLDHQSLWNGDTKTQEYNPGGGGWAPIMGNSYSQPASTWYNGTASDHGTQDDLAVIARSTNGFGYRPDDHANFDSAASGLAFSGTSLSANGVITQTTDVDAFYFDSGSGPATLSAGTINPGANLDVVLSLHDSHGVLIASANPTSSPDASISTTLSAGRYYVHVASTGVYGRLGQYTLAGTIVPGQAPDSPEVGVASGPTNILDGQTSAITFGAAAAGAAGPTRTFTVTNYGGANLDLGSPQTPLGFNLLEPLASSLAPGQSDSFTVQLDTSTGGTHTGAISFTTNDADESLFDFAVGGTVVEPAPAARLVFDARHPASYTDADGDLVVISLRGPGYGVVLLPSAGYADASSVTLDGANGRSALTISTGAGQTTVTDLTVNGSLRQLYARTTQLVNGLTITGAVRKIILGDSLATGERTLSLGGSQRGRGAVVRLGHVRDASLISAAPIRQLIVDSWTDTDSKQDQIVAPRVAHVYHSGEFEASIAQTQPVSHALNSGGDRVDLFRSIKGLPVRLAIAA